MNYYTDLFSPETYEAFTQSDQRITGFRPRLKNAASRIKRVWEADPLLCPNCSREMRIVVLIDDRTVTERILWHLGLWEEGVRVFPSRAPPAPDEGVIDPCFDDPFPDYDIEPILAYANG